MKVFFGKKLWRGTGNNICISNQSTRRHRPPYSKTPQFLRLYMSGTVVFGRNFITS